MKSALLLPFFLSGGAAFSPPSSSTRSSSVQRYQTGTTTQINQMALEVVDEDSTEGASTDPFDTYKATSDQKTIAIRDISTGSGTQTVGDSDSQMLQISFTSNFVESKFTANLKEFDVSSMVFKTGERRCLPGLEEGLKGMKVGGRRFVKVPPNRGYGNNWYRGVVPPNSHLCFEVEVLKIAESPLEEFDMKLTEFGKPRAAAAAFLTTYLALSPFIHLPGSNPQFPIN